MFRNQARGTENQGKKEFVNVCRYYLSMLVLCANAIPAGPPPIRLSQTLHGECPPRKGSWASADDNAEQIRSIRPNVIFHLKSVLLILNPLSPILTTIIGMRGLILAAAVKCRGPTSVGRSLISLEGTQSGSFRTKSVFPCGLPTRYSREWDYSVIHHAGPEELSWGNGGPRSHSNIYKLRRTGGFQIRNSFLQY